MMRGFDFEESYPSRTEIALSSESGGHEPRGRAFSHVSPRDLVVIHNPSLPGLSRDFTLYTSDFCSDLQPFTSGVLL